VPRERTKRLTEENEVSDNGFGTDLDTARTTGMIICAISATSYRFCRGGGGGGDASPHQELVPTAHQTIAVEPGAQLPFCSASAGTSHAW